MAVGYDCSSEPPPDPSGEPAFCGVSRSGSRTGGTMRAGGRTMAQVADSLSGSVVDRQVIDRTGLTGTYSFELAWSTDAAAGGLDEPPMIFTALQEQLDLKLEPGRGLVRVLVIDRVSPPTEN